MLTQPASRGSVAAEDQVTRTADLHHASRAPEEVAGWTSGEPKGSCDCSDHDPDPLPQLTRPATPPAPPDQQDAPEPAPGGGTPPWWRRWWLPR